MLQIQLLGQFEVRADGKRITIASRPAQSLFAFLILTAGTAHRREKLAGMFWPETSDENARKNLRHELWRIRKTLAGQQTAENDYLLADEFTLGFNRDAEYWLDVSQLERPDLDLPALLSNLSAYQGELLPGFYEDWIALERERIQSVFEARMEQLLEQLIVAERWIAVQEWSERWLSFGNTPESAYRALMLASGVRGDIAKVAAIYQRCTAELLEHLGIEPSAETRALYDGLRMGTHMPRSAALQQSGTITFLFTDIEASTHLLDYLGDHYTLVLEKHHEILRAAIQKWNGHEVDTQGDAFFVTFNRAIDAVQCVSDAQRALATHSWPQGRGVRVRMGLHTGEPLIASTGYVGMDVHRAARIGDAGHGGQVLLSQSTRELVIHDLPPDLTIRELGEHRLKDLKYPTPIYQLVIEGLPTEFPALRTKFTGTEAPTAGEPPFKGLQYFEEADSDLFFGRELLTAKLVKRLREFSSPSEGPLTKFLSVIIGASGSGKSSLVRAGLIPALKKGNVLLDGTKPPKGSTDWRVHIITPTAHPLEELATELTRNSESVTAAATLMDDLLQDPRSLTLFLARQTPTQHTLLVLDQFEELFTLCRDEFEREAFIDNLLTTLDQSESKVTIILTLRADFYAHLAQYPELRDAVARQQEYIGPMTTDELRRAIEEPVKRGHWEFEAGLVDLILRDIGDEPGALPLLSHALLETWKRRAGHRLTLKGYADAGGVHGAIAHTAENVYQNLSTEEQIVTRNLFLRLTELGEGTEDTRRRASFNELMSHAENAAEVRAVMNILAEARLITLGEETAEVAHEALIREWPTLREWLNRDREGLQLHRHLTETSHEWEVLDREISVLYRGSRLAQANEWTATNPLAMNLQEKTFLEASNRQSFLDEQEREAQLQRELEAAQKLAETERSRAEEQVHSASRLRTRNRVITTVGSLAIILALLAGLFGVRAASNFNRAEAQRLALEANRLVQSGGSSEQIALLSLRSMKTHYTPEGDAALTTAAGLEYPVKSYTQPGIAWTVDFSPDGKYMLTGNDDTTVTLWDVRSEKELRRFSGHTNAIVAATFSPDGKTVLTAAPNDSIRMWDAATGQEMYRIVTEGIGRFMVYSHDGKSIFTSFVDHKIRRWDAASGKEMDIFLETPELVWRMAISPDDRYLLTLSSTAQLWDLQTGQEMGRLPFDVDPVQRIEFSSDGNYVLTGNTDGSAHLWDIKAAKEVRTFTGHTAAIYGTTFSPDNKYVVTSAGDKTVRIWDINTGLELRRFTFPAFVTTLAVSPDSKWVLAGGDDGTTTLWALESSPALPVLSHGAGVNGVAFSPDGKLALTGGNDGTARLWDAVTGEKLRDFTGHTDLINYGAAFSPDGKHIVTASWDATVRVWNAQTGEQVHQFVSDRANFHDAIYSPDGRTILTAGENGVRLWDAETGEGIRQFGDILYVYRATFSPDGKYILTSASSEDGKVRLWEASTGELLREYPTAPGGDMGSVDFSPDGKYIIADGDHNIIHLWDAQTGKELRQFIGHTSGIYTAVFSPDGRYIASASIDGTARLWDVQTGKELRRFTGHAAAVENIAFSPDGKIILTGSDDGTARFWDVDYDTTIEYLCSRLLRDFTEGERGQYGITDSAPTCPLE
jgi:WD40 repeat protein/class 3 adenylate cyclase